MKILFFDGSKSLRAVVKRYVKDIGIELVATDNLGRVYTLVQENAPAFAIIEWENYHEGMFGFIEKLLYDFPCLNIVMAVDHLDRDKLNDAFRRGISDFIIKPFSRDSFLQKVFKPLVRRKIPDDFHALRKKDEEDEIFYAGSDGNKSILIVDDSDLMRKLIKKELEPDGYSFFLARNGEEALAIAEKEHIDLVTLDIEMPVMNGYDVCKKLRINDKTQDIPVIIVSSRDDQKEKEKGFGVGAIEYFVKPFSPGNLRLFISNLFRAIEQKKFGRIAVVDNEPTTGHILKYSLKKRGYVAYLLRTGREFMKFLESNPVDIIIAEYDLPDTKAIDLFRDLGKNENLKFTPKIIVTSASRKDELIEALNNGADDYICKPFDMEELFARVQAHLRVRYLHQELKEKNRILQELSITDGLTGLLNRGYVEKRLRSEYSRSIRGGYALSCIMADIDNFKSINDTYGHDLGDLVLREIAQIMVNSSRISDIVGRYGGEEFILLLPNTTYKGALVVADRIRNTVMKHTFIKGDTALTRTISLGVSSFPETVANNENELVKLADMALYSAKKNGKNMVVKASSLDTAINGR